MKSIFHILSAVLLVSLLSALLFGCIEEQTEQVWFSFTDDTGACVALDSPPRTVAVLFSSYAELWSLCGGEVAVTVGESVERGLVPHDTLLVDNGAGKQISEEALLAAAPDLVLVSADVPAQVSIAARMREVGIAAACLRVESFSDYARIMRLFCDILGNNEGYDAYVTPLVQRIAVLKNEAKEKDSPRTLFLRTGSSASSLKPKRGSDHFAARMLSELGAENLADTLPDGADTLSMEEILRYDPEVIFVATMGNAQRAESFLRTYMEQDAAWQSLTAVKNERVVFLPKELFQYKPNQRYGDAYEFLWEELYGEK